MRALLPLSIALIAAGCHGSPGPEQTAYGVPRRDLTLQQPSEPTSLEVASPVELARAPVQPRVQRRVRQARNAVPVIHALARSRVEPAPAPTPVATPAPAAPSESDAPDPHALLPGQTVTVLPASTASTDTPASNGDWTDALPAHGRGGTTIRGGGGGNCGGRGHGGGGFRGLR